MKLQSIKSYLSCIRYYNIEQSHPDPFLKDMPRLHYVLRGIKSEEAKGQTHTKQRLPVTPTLLIKMYSSLRSNPHDFNNIMIWAASLVCFFGFMRSGEITIPSQSAYDPTVHLNFADISVDNPTNPAIIQLSIKQSKTDPFRQGVNIYLGVTGNILCPVTALLNYLSIRGNHSGLLFHFSDHSPLTKNKFTSTVRDILTKVGIDSTQYSGHSFRIGAASTAAANGVEDSIIQTLGRWKSSAYLTYVRIAPENLAALSCRLCNYH